MADGLVINLELLLVGSMFELSMSGFQYSMSMSMWSEFLNEFAV